MDKVFKILIVFALLMLVIVWSYRAREKKYREYYLFKQAILPFPGDPDWEMLQAAGTGAAADEQGNSLVFDPLTKLIYRYSGEGALTILRQGDHEDPKIMQEMLVPKNGRHLALDPQTGKLYLLTEGSVWIYGNS